MLINFAVIADILVASRHEHGVALWLMIVRPVTSGDQLQLDLLSASTREPNSTGSNAVVPAFTSSSLCTSSKGFFQGWGQWLQNGRLVVLVAVIVLALAAVAGVLIGRRREAAQAAAAYVPEDEGAEPAAEPAA